MNYKRKLKAFSLWKDAVEGRIRTKNLFSFLKFFLAKIWLLRWKESTKERRIKIKMMEIGERHYKRNLKKKYLIRFMNEKERNVENKELIINAIYKNYLVLKTKYLRYWISDTRENKQKRKKMRNFRRKKYTRMMRKVLMFWRVEALKKIIYREKLIFSQKMFQERLMSKVNTLLSTDTKKMGRSENSKLPKI